MPLIFDGQAHARRILDQIGVKVSACKKQGKTPKLVSILVGENRASRLYLTLKKKAGERVGIGVDIVNFPTKTPLEEILSVVNKYNLMEDVAGIMLQLPLPLSFTLEDRGRIIQAIDPAKDVDGMGEGKFICPVVLAVERAFREYQKIRLVRKVAVVGALGFIGRKIVAFLSTQKGLEVLTYDVGLRELDQDLKQADVIISATGKRGLISPEMVKAGAGLIDVGAPEAEFQLGACQLASFYTPVPGGIGPVTIAYLMSNTLEACQGDI